ncbi:MAG: PAS domain S-box protein [Actinomycetota bacterium]
MEERDPQRTEERAPIEAGDGEGYRRIVEQLPVVVYTHDGSRPPAMSYVSPQVERMLGVPAERWVEQPFYWITRIHPEDRERLLARVDAACIEERRSVEEYRFRSEDGRVVWVRDEVSPVRDDDGKVLFWQGMLSDITDLKATEEALVESERRSALMIESVSDHSMVMLDADGTIVAWNPGAERLFGYTEGEAVGKNVAMFDPEDQRHRGEALNDLRFAIEHGPSEHEAWRVRKDGSRFWGHVVTTPIWDEHRALVGVARVTRDLTERRDAERKLGQRVRQQAAVAELGMRALANAGAEPLMDEAAHIVARTLDLPFSGLFLVLDETVAIEAAKLRLAYGAGWRAGLVGFLELPPEPGSLLWSTLTSGEPIVLPEPAPQVARSFPSFLSDHGARASASVVLRVGARPIGVLLAASDKAIAFEDSEVYFLQAITNVLGSFLERMRAEDLLKAVDADRSRLLGRILTTQEEERAHVSRELHDDLAQVLTGMSLFAASLELTTTGEEQETVKRIGSMATEAAEAIRRLIFDLRPLELEDGLVDATHRLTEAAGERRGKPIDFVLHGESRRLGEDVEATMYRIAQETLSNIVKHAPKADASLTLRYADDRIEVVTRDTGPGFELTSVESENGHHVGLAGMNERAALIGAEFEIRSRAGEGTTVTLVVPAPEVSPGPGEVEGGQ